MVDLPPHLARVLIGELEIRIDSCGSAPKVVAVILTGGSITT